MTTQPQGKGKKKNKEVIKFSLDEFNQINAPHGHSVVNLKVTGLDWAATMADHESQMAETQQIIVPTAPRAQRGPDIDFDSLPTEPPFRISLFHVPIAAEEKDITDRFFNGIKVLRVEIQKASTTVELASRDDMYEALCKDGTSLKGKTVNVCLYGQQPQNNYNQDRYGGRGSNSSYGDRSYQSGGGFGSQRLADKYGDRSGGFNSQRDSYGSSYNRAAGGMGGNLGREDRDGPSGSGGYGGGQRYGGRDSYRNNRYPGGASDMGASEEPENWRAASTVKSISPQPPTQQPTASEESENWRARSTVAAPAPAPTYGDRSYQGNAPASGGAGFNNPRPIDRYSERDAYNSYNRSGNVVRHNRNGGGYGAPRYENRYNNRNNYRNNRFGGPDGEHASEEPENWRAGPGPAPVSNNSPHPPQPASSDEVENWRARPPVAPQDPPSEQQQTS